MHRMTRTFVVGCCAFLAGLALGSLQGSSGIFGSRRAVSVDFCFILQNPDVIGSRSFITRATIVSAFPHGSVLESDSCPKMGASFTEKLDRQDFSAELNERFKNDPYGLVPVQFEGTLYRPSLVRRVWLGVMSNFGVRDQTAPVTIRRYTGIGGQIECSDEEGSSQSPGSGSVPAKPSGNTPFHESDHVDSARQH